MTAERYEIAPATFTHGVAETMNLQQMQGFTVSPSLQKSRIRPGGTLDALAFMVGRGKPTTTFTTRDLFTILTEMSPTSGLCVSDAIFRELERDECNAWTGGGVTFNSQGGGLIYPDTLTASLDDADGAMLSCTFMPFWDGTNDPIEAAYVADMSAAPAAAFVSQYFLGPVYKNAAEILGVTQSSVNFGLTVSGSPKSPGPYDNTCAITDRQATFTFSTTKSNAQLLMFGECDVLSMYFQKGASCSDRVPAATSEHIKVSCTTGFFEVTSTGGEAAADAQVQVTVSPVGPITLSLASAIP